MKALSTIIESRDIVENILLAKKYRVKQWLRDGYLKLMQQPEPGRLDIDKLRSSNVDLLTIARLWSIYGTIMANRCKAHYCGQSQPTEVTHAEADPLITKIFADEFREMELEDFWLNDSDFPHQLAISPATPENTPSALEKKKKKKK